MYDVASEYSNDSQINFDTLDDTNETDTDENNKKFDELSKNKSLYKNSKISTGEFSLAFLVLSKRIKINKVGRNILLDFIKTILPPTNEIPSSYNQLLKCVALNAIKTTKICEDCLKEKCNCHISNTENKISVHEFDVENQLRSIVNKHWVTMCNYNGY